jgi:ketosteroid isomerase-like protein
MSNTPNITRRIAIATSAAFAAMATGFVQTKSTSAQSAQSESETLSSTAEQTRRVGMQAWERFQNAWATGEWQPFLDMLTDDFTFWFPEGEFRGRFSGREGKERVVAWANFHRQAGNRVRTVPTHISVGENTIVFENESESIPAGSYQNWEAVAFEVRGEKISALREYWGNLQAIT